MFCAMAAVTAACPLNVRTGTPMSKDLRKLFYLIFGFVALGPTTSMAQGLSPFSVQPTAPVLNPSAPLTLPTHREPSVSPSLPNSLLPAPTYQTSPFTGLPCSTGSSLSTSTTTTLPGTLALPDTGIALQQMPSFNNVFGTQSSLGPC
jgi:hypothetical protein